MAGAPADRPAVVEVAFDAKAHSIDAIQRAAYRFSDRVTCELIVGEVEHRCLLTAVEDGNPSAHLDHFRNEVLDQVLRERIRAETGPVRTMILAHAFSRTGIADPQDTT